ncbi:rhomboid-related protein 4-like [Corythoichthys intestinalis]|uniref:rhomboid-related protein 4 n=1 Tax=Corythoichthys intestinalis TaxID=161448 RepID=UPI0025A4D14B|nr:rhomboid-related protein 4 [Corythoichthys intestinalis]XP_057695870.1 rhomboid-related protein 4-like [Corythoichthys intestinalis]XP_057695871.1 rhomboid-related protein 4-like [Corythoichthys intestinalis]XP_061796950.1 rhomboid-related protein 4-like [Nerophis lumbriciformis]
MRGRQRSPHLGLLLLFFKLYQVGLENIPPVTLAMLGLNTYFFLLPAAELNKVCLSVHQVYNMGEWLRLFLSPFHHADSMHLYFNMASFLIKSIRLESLLGSTWFASILAIFSLLTGVVYLALELGLTYLTQEETPSMACAVGFSGVIFALKVLNNHYHPGSVTYLLGFPISNRYASWVELILIHITTPGTSFVGHLAGILVGLLYTTGPLKKVMEMCAGMMSSNTLMPRTSFKSSGCSGRHSVGSRSTMDKRSSSRYTSGMTEEDQLAAAIRDSLRDTGRHRGDSPLTGHPPYGIRLTDKELRARRLMRLDGLL